MKQRHPAAHLLNAIAEGETEFETLFSDDTWHDCDTDRVLKGISVGNFRLYRIKPDDWTQAKFGDKVWSDDFFGGYCTFVAYRDGTVYVTGDSIEGKGFEAQVATNPRLIKE